MNESKRAMLELAEEIEKAEMVDIYTRQDGSFERHSLNEEQVAGVVAALRASAPQEDGRALEAGNGTWQETINLAARARERAHHYFLNSKTHDLLIECAEQLEALAPMTAVPALSAPPSEGVHRASEVSDAPIGQDTPEDDATWAISFG